MENWRLLEESTGRPTLLGAGEQPKVGTTPEVPKSGPEVVGIQLKSSGGGGSWRRSRQVSGRRCGGPPAASLQGPVEQSQVQ